MKKYLVLVVCLLALASAGFAGDWGLGVKLGGGRNDPQAMQFINDSYSSDLDKHSGLFGVEAFYEFNLSSDSDKLGLKIGYDKYGENELNGYSPFPVFKATENTFAVPVTVYYKRDNGLRAFSYFAGAGVSFFRTEVKSSYDSQKSKKNRLTPHVKVGTEYRFTKLFALGAEVKYVFNARMVTKESEGLSISDRSGFSGAITGRFYF